MMTLLAALSRSAMCRHNIMAGLAGLALGSISGYLLIVWADHNAPVVVHEEHEVDGGAARNGHIDIYFALDRTRDCPSETSRWLWTWVDHNGERIKQFYPLVSSATTISDAGRDQHFIVTVPVPPGVWPGQWFYWSKTVEHCSLLPSLFRTPARESSDIPIQIFDNPR